MPSTSIDTFFACTIIVAAALIATAFLSSTMQTTIDSTQNINKESYLQAIADHIISNPGTPTNWGTTTNSVPTDFGLASSSSTIPYELDIDKITRLNNLNNYSFSYSEMANAAKLNNIAFGITVSQVMSISIQQLSNSTIGNEGYFNFTILTAINCEAMSASLNCYVLANNYLSNVTDSTSNVGVGYITFQIPNSATDNAMLIVFARASFDDRITSYAIYNFQNSAQELAPNNSILTLSPLNYVLNIASNSSDVAVQNGYIFSFSTEKNLAYTQGENECPIPNIIDKSPFVLVALRYR